jgi:hypothetical protein
MPGSRKKVAFALPIPVPVPLTVHFFVLRISLARDRGHAVLQLDIVIPGFLGGGGAAAVFGCLLGTAPHGARETPRSFFRGTRRSEPGRTEQNPRGTHYGWDLRVPDHQGALRQWRRRPPIEVFSVLFFIFRDWPLGRTDPMIHNESRPTVRPRGHTRDRTLPRQHAQVTAVPLRTFALDTRGRAAGEFSRR